MFKKLHPIVLLLLANLFMASAQAEDLLLTAQAAYKSRNLPALELAFEGLKAQQNNLAPYADYWAMLLSLSEASDEGVQAFLVQYADYPFADRVRGEYLKKLAKAQNWPLFNAELVNYHREDTAVACYTIEARIADQNSANQDITLIDSMKPLLDSVKPLWLSAAEQPANCEVLFASMARTGLLTQDLVLARFRLALQEGKNNLAANIGKLLNSVDSNNLKLIDTVYANPKASLDKKSLSLKTVLGRELNIYAIERLARSDSAMAASQLQKIQDNLSEDERRYAYGRVAFHAARKHLSVANGWFAESDIKWLDKDQRAWKTRAAMREANWGLVLSSINDMPEDQQSESTWRYWKARALVEQKQLPLASPLLAELANEPGYYGLLAIELSQELNEKSAQKKLAYKSTETPIKKSLETSSEKLSQELDVDSGLTPDLTLDLGLDLGIDLDANLPLPSYKPTHLELDTVNRQPAISRAIALQRLDLRAEAKAEWAWGLKDADDKTLIAAAQIAQNIGWNDVSINTAEKTKLLHNFELRYPLHHYELMMAYSAENNLDAAWVYGLIRQESRFISVAKSNVGASGLMQIMPATAQWIAKRLKDNDFKQADIHGLDTNIRFGTHYLKYTSNVMDGQQAMATAAYNAGPGRPKRWAAAQELEGAIYVDSIPLMETRDYVRKVLANAQYYAQRLNLKPVTLKSRLGVIAAIATPPKTQAAENE